MQRIQYPGPLSLFLRLTILQCWIRSRYALLSLSFSVVATCAALAGWMILSTEQAHVEADLTRDCSNRGFVRTIATPVMTELSLPPFSSRDLVKTFGNIAGEANGPIEEVTNAFESAAGQPYRRYRVSLSVETAICSSCNSVVFQGLM